MIAKELEIYKETEKLRPFRPLREQGSYIIMKAQAYLNLGDLDECIKLSLKGIQMASEYRSRRQVGWLDKTYNCLRVLPIGKEKPLQMLGDALAEVQKKQRNW